MKIRKFLFSSSSRECKEVKIVGTRIGELNSLRRVIASDSVITKNIIICPLLFPFMQSLNAF